jgi:hypothetical protein
MKRLAVATLLSSLLVAGVSVASFIVWRRMHLDLSSPVSFWSTALMDSSFLATLILLPAALIPRSILQSAAAVLLASLVGTVAAVTVVVFWIWGARAQPSDGNTEVLFQLQRLMLPSAIAFVLGAPWSFVKGRRSREGGAGV